MRRFFPFRSFTSNGGDGKAAPANDTRNEDKVDETDASGAPQSPGTRSFRSRSQHSASRKKDSSHPQLRRCLSFTSSAIDRSLDERIMSFSHDIPCSMSNGSDAPRHVSDADRYTWSPERHPNGGEYTINVPKSHGSQETDSPRSKCYSCSTGQSPVSSPVALKCRPARLTKLLNKNEVLDLYIDAEQEVTRLNEKQKQKLPIRSTVPYLGRGQPPRPHSTAPCSPKSCKEIIEDSNYDIDDVWHSQLAQEGSKATCKVASMCDEDRNDARLLEASSENLSHIDVCKAQRTTTVDDIYEDLQDVQPPCFYNTSVDFTTGATSRYFASDLCPHDECHGFCDNNLDQDTDVKLLRRAKELDACLMVPPVENSDLNVPRDKRSNSTEMLQMIQSLIEDRKLLASELSSQIKARLTERFSAKEQYRRSKVELATRTRRLEKEKTDVKSTLERELDRRSNAWSVKLEKFQSEEQRLRERVRELAEQNVSFQREITLLESDKVDASNRITSLELQNKELNNELNRIKNDHDNLHNSSVELHENFTKAAEERDQLRECLREKEEDNKALHKVIVRLQRVSNEQEKTINGLRQGFIAELEKRAAGSTDGINRMQMELVRLTGVEQKLRSEVKFCTLELEPLRQENITILNRLQRSKERSSLSSLRLDQELHDRVENLQTQGLSLLDDTMSLCAKLLDLIKSKRSESSESFDALSAIEYTLKYQHMKERMENVKQSLCTINSVLTEKQNEDRKIGHSVKLSRDDFEIKLREEALINRVLKEKLLSRELDIEQLQSDLAASARIQDVMQNETQRVQDELRCLTHESKQLEVQVLKKDEIINQIQQDYQESAKELSALRCTLKTVTDERDVLWQESKQLRKTVSALQNDIASLQQKIRSLDEDIKLKESEILLREGEISILRDSIDRPFDIICSPRSLKQFGME